MKKELATQNDIRNGGTYSTVDCFRPPSISILCSRLNRKPSTQILDPKNLRCLLRKNLVSNLPILARGQRIIFPFHNFCPQNPMKRATESSRKTEKVSNHILLLAFFHIHQLEEESQMSRWSGWQR